MQNRQQKHQQKQSLKRPPSFNLDSELSTKLFQRIMVRLKVQKVIKHWKKLSKNSFNRYKRLQQWVMTQKSYIQDLKLITTNIQRPLRQKQLITEQQQRIIFPNMSSIIMLSQEMYMSMKQLLSQWDPLKTQIAPAVMKLSSFFKIYIEYFRNYQKGKEILARLAQDKEYKAIVRGLKMDVDSYLIKPTQRPVKYKLLLTDYQKKLRKDHPDYHALSKAIETYHQVVEKTNQALENQQHMRKMIKMEAKFKNILQSSRQWKFQFQAWYGNNQDLSKIYVFTDLILIVESKSANKERLLCKMFLDSTSFVEAQQQIIEEKRRRLFIAGRDQVAYFSFLSVQQRNETFQQLARIINSLHVNQQKRKAQISKNQSRRYSSFRFSKPYYIEDYYQVFDQYNTLKKKFRVTVNGVHRRYANSIKNQYFVIKLQLPFPQVISQRALVKFEDLIDLEKLLWASLNKWALVKDQNLQKIRWQPLISLPKQLSKCSQLQQQSKVLEYRSMRIQEFLNFVLRNRQTLKTSNLIFHKLKMFECLYEKIIDERNQCENCRICEFGEIISNYQAYVEEQQMRLKTKQERGEENLCVERSFHSQNRFASITKQKPRQTIDEILLYINSKLGYINQSLTNRIIQGDSIKIDIYIPAYKDIFSDDKQTRQKWIPVDIYKKDTVGNLLEIIRKEMKINSIKDFGFVLIGQKQNVYEILHDDEYIFDLMKQHQLDLESSASVKNNNEDANRSTFRGFFSKIKEKFDSPSEQKHKIPSIRLELRKLYTFQAQIEQFTCFQDPQRYNILSQFIFYLFKSKQLNLHHTNIVKLCSLFICIQYNNCFQLMKKEEISKSLLSEIIPQSRLHLVNDNFLNQVWKILSIYVQKHVSDRKLFSAELIELVNDCPGWNMQFFIVENLQQSMSLPELWLKIGINSQQLYVIRQNNYLAPVIKIKLQKLIIRYSGYLLSIQFDQRQYRFLCGNLFILKTILEKYESYNKFFLGKDRVQRRPLMQETV